MKALELLAFLIDTPFKGCFGLIREARDDCKREIGQSGVSGFILSSKYYLLDRMTSHPRVSYLPLTVIPTWGVWDLDPQWWTSQLEFRFLVMCARYSIVWWWCSNTVTKQARPPQFAILLQWSGRHALYFDGEMMTFFLVNKVWSWPRHSLARP